MLIQHAKTLENAETIVKNVEKYVDELRVNPAEVHNWFLTLSL